jgi:hypothetical protein
MSDFRMEPDVNRDTLYHKRIVSSVRSATRAPATCARWSADMR